MRAETWRSIRRRLPMWSWLDPVYTWVCHRQHEAIEREKFERMLRRVVGEARRARP